jgi:hypothetical protein
VYQNTTVELTNTHDPWSLAKNQNLFRERFTIFFLDLRLCRQSAGTSVARVIIIINTTVIVIIINNIITIVFINIIITANILVFIAINILAI